MTTAVLAAFTTLNV